MTTNDKFAVVQAKHMAHGTMKQPKGFYENIELQLTISPDIRIMDMEKLFAEIQNMFILWTRDLDTDYKYVIEKVEE